MEAISTVTTLGLGGSGRPKLEAQVALRTGPFRHVGVAVAGAGGAALILGAFELLKAQPDKSFQLLQLWGPAFLVAMLAIAVAGKFLDGLLLTVRESFSVVANSVHDSAEAAGRQADALTRLADQGSRQTEEIQRLAIYSAQEFPGVYERFDRQDETLSKLATSVTGLYAMLSQQQTAHLQEREHDGSGS